ncbi:major facilitator superfamily transporter [Colletotrichum falcatum]|nr:major facilitator superfamily transporter [Colletotrichum falcatum]
MLRQDHATETERLLLGSASGEEGYEGGSPSPTHGLNDMREHGQDQIALKVAATAWSFIVLGLFVSTTGVIIPHLQRDYRLTDMRVSSVFLVGPVGYCSASWLSSRIHLGLGQRGVAVIGPACHLFYAAAGALRPPFPAFLLSVGVGSFGMGLLDGSWCAWVAGLESANALSGILHGSFSAGAAVCPYVAGILISKNGGLWHQWFYVLSLASAAEILILCLAFGHEDANKCHDNKADSNRNPLAKVDQRKALTYSATWVYAAYLLAEVGTESTVSGWVVAFMLRIRHTGTYSSSVCSSGFWGGMAAGRLALGFVTDKLGARRAVTLYLVLAPVFVVLFTVIRVLWVSVLAMSLVGFFMGPLFPSCIVQLVSFLPRGLHVGAVSFVASVGQIGGAILPYLLGVITQVMGLRVFPYMLLAQFVVMLLFWVFSLTLSRKEADAEEEGQVYHGQ